MDVRGDFLGPPHGTTTRTHKNFTFEIWHFYSREIQNVLQYITKACLGNVVKASEEWQK